MRSTSRIMFPQHLCDDATHLVHRLLDDAPILSSEIARALSPRPAAGFTTTASVA